MEIAILGISQEEKELGIGYVKDVSVREIELILQGE
jgi:hypothetical protein